MCHQLTGAIFIAMLVGAEAFETRELIRHERARREALLGQQRAVLGSSRWSELSEGCSGQCAKGVSNSGCARRKIPGWGSYIRGLFRSDEFCRRTDAYMFESEKRAEKYAAIYLDVLENKLTKWEDCRTGRWKGKLGGRCARRSAQIVEASQFLLQVSGKYPEVEGVPTDLRERVLKAQAGDDAGVVSKLLRDAEENPKCKQSQSACAQNIVKQLSALNSVHGRAGAIAAIERGDGATPTDEQAKAEVESARKPPAESEIAEAEEVLEVSQESFVAYTELAEGDAQRADEAETEALLEAQQSLTEESALVERGIFTPTNGEIVGWIAFAVTVLIVFAVTGFVLEWLIIAAVVGAIIGCAKWGETLAGKKKKKSKKSETADKPAEAADKPEGTGSLVEVSDGESRVETRMNWGAFGKCLVKVVTVPLVMVGKVVWYTLKFVKWTAVSIFKGIRSAFSSKKANKERRTRKREEKRRKKEKRKQEKAQRVQSNLAASPRKQRPNSAALLAFGLWLVA